MKKFSTNLKYFTLSLALIFAIFSVAKSAYADNTAAYACTDGSGGIAMGINLDMLPTRGPFPANSNTTFDAQGQIFSTCYPKVMNLKVTNNNNSGNPVQTLVQDTLISPGVYPAYPQPKTFSVPNPAGSYNLHFVLGVDEDDVTPPQNSCTAYVRFIGAFRYGGVIWIGPATHPEVHVNVALVGNLAQHITTNDPYDTQVITIPANTSQSSMSEIYGVEGFDHGWVVSTDLASACGDQGQNYLAGAQYCDGTVSPGNNKSCVNQSTGWRITDPAISGTIPTGCRYSGLPNQSFCSGHQPYTNSAYCPTPAGACN